MTNTETIQQLALAGIGRMSAEAAIGHAFNEAELAAFRAAHVRYQLLEKKRKADKAANRTSRAEQERRRRARADEVVIPPCANPRRRERCRKSLVA